MRLSHRIVPLLEGFQSENIDRYKFYDFMLNYHEKDNRHCAETGLLTQDTVKPCSMASSDSQRAPSRSHPKSDLDIRDVNCTLHSGKCDSHCGAKENDRTCCSVVHRDWVISTSVSRKHGRGPQ